MNFFIAHKNNHYSVYIVFNRFNREYKQLEIDIVKNVI
jgi:hypothetical protein